MELSGRKFTRGEITAIQETVSICAGLSFNEIALTICEHFDWTSTNGKFKVDSAKEALKKLESLGKVKLPTRRRYTQRNKNGFVITERSGPREKIECSISDLGELKFVEVEDSSDKRLWGEFLERYHYLGFRKKFGNTIQYFVKDQNNRFLACIEYSPGSMSIEKRDKWIGWTKDQKNKYLELVINNSRFLILPWIKVHNLASKILSLSLPLVANDWQRKFGITPVLAESFVDSGSFHGGCYIAANWKQMGMTKGRGRDDKNNQSKLTPKKIFVMPIRQDFRKSLLGEIRKSKSKPKYRMSCIGDAPNSLIDQWVQISETVRIISTEYDEKWQKRKRVLNSFILVMLIFRLVLAKNGQSYAQTIAALWDDHKHLGLELPQQEPISQSSFSDARKKLSPNIFKTINNHIISVNGEPLPKYYGLRSTIF